MAQFLFAAVAPLSNLAYIDPSSGGMLFQVLAVMFGLFSGFIFFFSRQIKSGFARFKRYIHDRVQNSE